MANDTPRRHRASNDAQRARDHVVGARRERQYLDVPFADKDEAKRLGARWHRQRQAWFVPAGVDPCLFAKWAHETPPEADRNGHAAVLSPAPVLQIAQRVYLAVPYGERAAAKAAGAVWDKSAKSWYAGPGADSNGLARWLPENLPGAQTPAMTPQDEFADALRSLGCLVDGEHPMMDGKTHRIQVLGDKKGAPAGFYVGYLDGHPAGYVKNNRTGVEMRWKSKAHALTAEAKEQLQAEAAAKLARRAAEQRRLQEDTALRVSRQARNLIPIERPTPYLQAKGIEPHRGALTDKTGRKTYIPGVDVDGTHWTTQYIGEDGTKRFAKDSRKEGCFHPVGGMDSIAAAPVLVIAEGYATAATLAEALRQPTIAAFDSSNLEAVAKALHERYPGKAILVAGDDDRNQVMTHGANPGLTKAHEAAKAVGGIAILPFFAFGENVWPDNLPAITPETFFQHEQAMQRLAALEAANVPLAVDERRAIELGLLTSEQLAALAAMKSHTDFNDLARSSALGLDTVRHQVAAAIESLFQARGSAHAAYELAGAINAPH